MSLAAESIPVAKVVDHRVSFPKWSMPVREGGSTVSYLRASATSLGSTVQFDIVPPSPSSAVVGRDMLWYNKVTFTIANPAAAPENPVNLVTPGVYDAPRAFPITSCVDTMSIQINNETVTLNNWSEIGHVLRRFNPRSAMYKLSNFCPWFADQSSDYSTLSGSARDVLGAGATGDYDFMRGAYARFTVAAGATPQAATVTLETYEPINVSPFMYGSQSPGIPYVQTMGLRFNIGDFSRALSHANATTNLPITPAMVSSVHNASVLFYQSITIPALEDTLPRSVTLPHFRLLTNTTPQQALASNVPTLGVNPAGTTFASQVINYPCVPSRIYVFCAPALSSKTPQTPDYTAQFCGGLSVQWNSRTALMTSVQREQLYSQAVDAGLAMPWEQFDSAYRFSSGGPVATVGGSGSILCIRPGVDFDLEAGVVAGQAGSYQFQVQANFNNQGLVAYPFQMYVVAVLPGTITLNAGYETRVEIGVISQADVLAATEKIHPSAALDTYGAGFFDNVKSMIHKAWSDPMGSARTAMSAAHKLASLAKDAEPILSAAKGAIGAGAYSGGADFYSSGGSAFSGGAILSKKGLAARLR